MTGPGPMAAILGQLAAHAEQIAALDTARAGHAGQLAALAARLDAQLAAITGQAGGGGERPGGEPASQPPARRWWQLAGTEREQAVAALRSWAGQVYQPGYGQLAASLGPCWDQHPLCLYAMDILAGLWQVLYPPGQHGEPAPGLLSARAEYQARILPALAAQMAAETSRCRHHPRRPPAAYPRSPR